MSSSTEQKVLSAKDQQRVNEIADGAAVAEHAPSMYITVETPRGEVHTVMKNEQKQSASTPLDHSEQPIIGMVVTKRNGSKQPFSYDAIQRRLVDLATNPKYGPRLDDFILEPRRLFDMMRRIYDCIVPGMTTANIDRNAADVVSGLHSSHPDYGRLAARICVSNLHKQTSSSFYETMKRCHENVHYLSAKDPTQVRKAPMITDEFLEWLRVNQSWIEPMIDYRRDYDTDMFAFKTMENSYLWKVNAYETVKQPNGTVKVISKKVPCERPQHMYMREALQVADQTQEAIQETYDLLSKKYGTHATPTMFNAKRVHGQLASCFLINIPADSVKGIHTAEGWLHEISANMGGVGINVTNIRMNGAYVARVDGVAQGVVPMIKVMNQIALHITQGGKRKGSFAFYIEPWHGDIYSFLNMHSGKAAEHLRAMESFYGLMICDLFMKRVEANEKWSLFCPGTCPDLADCWGDEFEAKYIQYEKEGKAVQVVNAADLHDFICQQRTQTGYPYIIYKDSMNRKSNQQHLGTIKTSNLCTEIALYTSPAEIAVCNLASICLNQFVQKDEITNELLKQLPMVVRQADATLLAELEKRVVNKHACRPHDLLVSKIVTQKVKVTTKGRTKWIPKRFHVWYDGSHLRRVVATKVRNLNNVIDRTSYPVPECATSNFRHRPIGVGVQGQANGVVAMRMPFDSIEAQEFNRLVYECMYLAAVQESCRLVKCGARQPYESFRNYKNDKGQMVDSPMSKGIFQFDMWTDPAKRSVEPSRRYADEWKQTKSDVMEHGLCNSVMIAPMPTATTSLMMGNSQSFEPFPNNIFVKRTITGEFVCYNDALVDDLSAEGLWNAEMKNYLIANNGSIQKHPKIPPFIKELYKRADEIDEKVWIDMAGYAGRGPFIDQTQSFSIHTEYKGDQLKEYLKHHDMYAWKVGLKTGTYYIKQAPAIDAIKFSIPIEQQSQSFTHEEHVEEVDPLEESDRTADRFSKNRIVEDPECQDCANFDNRLATLLDSSDSTGPVADEPKSDETRACSLDNPDCEACSS